MKNIIRPFLSVTLLLSCLLILNGCIFPAWWEKPYGYSVNFSVRKLTEDDIKSLEKLLRESNFYRQIRSAGSRDCSWYARDVVSRQKTDFPYIWAGICPSSVTHDSHGPVYLISIFNEEAQVMHIQEDIDKLGDLVLSKLKQMVGEDNIEVDRRPMGLPII